MMKYVYANTRMITACVALLAVAFVTKCYGAAPVPVEMVMRNGLTDAQIRRILSKDPNAVIHIDGSTWRNVEFNTQRYNNVTNWLAIIGEKNDFARLVVPVTATNELLKAENASLRAENKELADKLDTYYSAYTNAIAQAERLQADLNTLREVKSSR